MLHSCHRRPVAGVKHRLIWIFEVHELRRSTSWRHLHWMILNSFLDDKCTSIEHFTMTRVRYVVLFFVQQKRHKNPGCDCRRTKNMHSDRDVYHDSAIGVQNVLLCWISLFKSCAPNAFARFGLLFQFMIHTSTCSKLVSWQVIHLLFRQKWDTYLVNGLFPTVLFQKCGRSNRAQIFLRPVLDLSWIWTLSVCLMPASQCV